MSISGPIQVVIPERSASWAGGRNYLEVIKIAALQLEKAGVVQVINACPETKTFSANRAVLDRTMQVTELIRGLKVLNLPWPLTRFSRKSMYWIPDCQDIELPGFFSETERRNRLNNRLQAIHSRRAIYFSSEDARDTFINRFECIDNISGIVRFSTPVSEQPMPENDIHLNCKDCLTQGYFYLPNQWWVHKNHKIAIEAFKRYRLMGGSKHLILTGDSSDYRWPQYQDELKSIINSIPSIHNYGFVDRDFQRFLYVNATTVLQPSLYEGWSSTVEESLSFGTPIICSDINILREQTLTCNDVSYFNPNSAEELTLKLLSPPKPVNSEEVLDRSNFRWQRFVSDLGETIQRSSDFTANV